MAQKEGISMIGINETEALATLFANTRKKKRNIDLLTLAENLEFLKNIYKDTGKVAKKVGLTKEMVRELLLPLYLPDEIKTLVRSRKIDRIGDIVEISKIKDNESKLKFALSLAGFTSDDVRDLKRMVKYTNIDLNKAVKTLTDLKDQNLHIIVIDVKDSTYKNLKKKAAAARKNVPEFVRDLMEEFAQEGVKK
jgi:hypothetical protein